jgi:transcriptional regulator with XRE-family HTH domain
MRGRAQTPRMSTRERPLDRARRHGLQDRARIGAELRAARLAVGRSLASAATAAGMSLASASRIEAGGPIHVPLEKVAALGAVVGLDVRLRAFPGPDPSLDAGQIRLIERLRRRLPAQVRLQTEARCPSPATSEPGTSCSSG